MRLDEFLVDSAPDEIFESTHKVLDTNFVEQIRRGNQIGFSSKCGTSKARARRH